MVDWLNGAHWKGCKQLVACILAVLACSQLLLAQQPSPTIPYLDPIPTIDGIPDDWPGTSIITHLQENKTPENANRMDVQLGWSAQQFFLLVEVRDRNVISLSNRPDRLYLNDAVELYIDPLDDSRDRMDINDYQFIVDHTGATAVLKGDRSLIMDSSNTAPKEQGIATIAFEWGAHDLAPDAQGVGGYAVEMALPFAAMGVLPKAGMHLKIDVCVDDVDTLVDLETLPEGEHLPGFFASNWDGYRDFSFPDHWRSFELAGGPSLTTQINTELLPYWLYIVLALAAVSAAIIGWQAYRIAQLRDVLPRKSVRPSVMRQLAQAQAQADAPAEAETATAIPAAEPPATAAPPVELPLPPQTATSDAEEAEIIPASPSTQAPLHPQLERCRQYILAHLDEDLKMEDLASECAMSLRSLQRLFKDELEMSPLNFVVLIKMERAAEMLRTGSCNVSEAAWQLGFTDSSYFSRVFKKYHGVSPKSMLAA